MLGTGPRMFKKYAMQNVLREERDISKGQCRRFSKSSDEWTNSSRAT